MRAQRVVHNLFLSRLIRPPRYYSIPVVGAAVFVMFIISAQVLGAILPAPPDYFAWYDDIFPGQPRSALEAHGFTCPVSFFGLNRDVSPETCVSWPASGVFLQIRVVVSQDTIRQIDFVIREDTLKLGDLMALWQLTFVNGIVEYTGNVGHYYWFGDIRVTTRTVNERHSLWSPLDSVSITYHQT